MTVDKMATERATVACERGEGVGVKMTKIEKLFCYERVMLFLFTERFLHMLSAIQPSDLFKLENLSAKIPFMGFLVVMIFILSWNGAIVLSMLIHEPSMMLHGETKTERETTRRMVFLLIMMERTAISKLFVEFFRGGNGSKEARVVDGGMAVLFVLWTLAYLVCYYICDCNEEMKEEEAASLVGEESKEDKEASAETLDDDEGDYCWVGFDKEKEMEIEVKTIKAQKKCSQR